MKIHYAWAKHGVEVQSSRDCLSDINALPSGVYFMQALDPSAQSQYSGLHFPVPSSDGWQMYSSVYDFSYNHAHITHVQKNFDSKSTTLFTKDGHLKYHLVDNVLHVQNQKMPFNLRLDCKKLYDYDTKGRIYMIEQKGNDTIIKYTKYTADDRQNKQYDMFVVVRSTTPPKIVAKWERVEHQYDALRGTQPQEWYVYNALAFEEDCRVRIGYGFTQEEAYGLVAPKIARNYVVHLPDLSKTHSKLTFKQSAAFVAAAHNLQDLIVLNESSVGLYAGLPWFFHWWTRDEAVALGALFEAEQYDVFKRIVLRQLKRLGTDGRLPNRFPHANLGTADGTGWLFYQLRRSLHTLKRNAIIHEVYSQGDLRLIHSGVKQHVDGIIANYMRDDLVWSHKDETWMDTSYGGDIRQGACIEIQALFMSALRLLMEIEKFLHIPSQDHYEEQYDKTLNQMQKFFDGQRIADRLDENGFDFTQRSNIFLAAYVYQDMFTVDTWKTALASALDALWCPWGGLASIEKNNHLFVGDYDPRDNRSYHRGDSWYWVNNLAAIVLHRVDAHTFGKKSHAIVEASIQELLHHGALGCAAEVSSANKLESRGCFSQLWSASTLYQALNYFYRN